MTRFSGLAVIGILLGSFSSCYLSIPGIDTNTVKHFDCPKTTRAKLSQKQLQAAMDEFAYMFYTEKKLKKAFNKYVASNYVQHNPDILDGRDAALAGLAPIFGPVTNSFEIARVMVGPEYTTIHVRAKIAGHPNDLNVMDVYRTKGSCIIEHWDSLQLILPDRVNAHPYF
ncbi:hypothetical protein Micbo1qcDRAFT_186084 [Microdochium bolleyi]|uniref:SnoaL-like domain-containing protein n=1 Tax=Microdochium bolleyi TaxID=196109 RepID=A0A136IN76_9PEZI|nr:hypothetical protein Micbo1qcDRAFT_186084 [Microdochium bolleyi]